MYTHIYICIYIYIYVHGSDMASLQLSWTVGSFKGTLWYAVVLLAQYMYTCVYICTYKYNI